MDKIIQGSSYIAFDSVYPHPLVFHSTISLTLLLFVKMHSQLCITIQTTIPLATILMKSIYSNEQIIIVNNIVNKSKKIGHLPYIFADKPNSLFGVDLFEPNNISFFHKYIWYASTF